MLNIEPYLSKINKFCENQPIQRLGLFGSSLTDNFRDDSDIDILVVFDRKENLDYFAKYFEIKINLESIFSRTVDLVVDKRFKNPYFQKVVDRTRQVIYER